MLGETMTKLKKVALIVLYRRDYPDILDWTEMRRKYISSFGFEELRYNVSTKKEEMYCILMKEVRE